MSPIGMPNWDLMNEGLGVELEDGRKSRQSFSTPRMSVQFKWKGDFPGMKCQIIVSQPQIDIA